MQIKIANISTLQYANTLIPELSPAYSIEKYQERLSTTVGFIWKKCYD